MVTNPMAVMRRENARLQEENERLHEELRDLREFVHILNDLTVSAKNISSVAAHESVGRHKAGHTFPMEMAISEKRTEHTEKHGAVRMMLDAKASSAESGTLRCGLPDSLLSLSAVSATPASFRGSSPFCGRRSDIYV